MEGCIQQPSRQPPFLLPGSFPSSDQHLLHSYCMQGPGSEALGMKPTESLLPDREEEQRSVVSTVMGGSQEVVRTRMWFQPDLMGRGV